MKKIRYLIVTKNFIKKRKIGDILYDSIRDPNYVCISSLSEAIEYVLLSRYRDNVIIETVNIESSKCSYYYFGRKIVKIYDLSIEEFRKLLLLL